MPMPVRRDTATAKRYNILYGDLHVQTYSCKTFQFYRTNTDMGRYFYEAVDLGR